MRQPLKRCMQAASLLLAGCFLTTAAVAQTAGEGLSPTLAAIKKDHVVRLGYRESSPPFSFMDPSNRPIGYSLELCEAIVEEIGPKKKLFAELDTICSQATIFCSNTSSLTIVEMAAATKRPDRFAGLHFFNPPVIMKLVEIVKALTTSDATIATLRDFVARLGKTGVLCKDTTGFIVNRLMVPYLLGAVRMLELGIATKEDIDQAVKLGLGYPMGPFELIDYTGVDINYHVANVFFDEFKDPSMAPPSLLRRMTLAGQLGTKTGKGFYEYDEQGKRKS